ncbi:MAG: hypothetical protein JWQ08_2849, partial [Deinococcus sp.]|nr:hypothetical protein [Deinococcus sp.]
MTTHTPKPAPDATPLTPAFQAPAPLESVTLSGPDLGTVNMNFVGAPTEADPVVPGPEQNAEQGTEPASGATLNPYEAALPRPDPLSAEQFMPVLPPDQYATFLNDLKDELTLVADPPARSLLTKRARILALNVEQYRVNHALARQTLTRVLAETGVGVRDSWARQDEHLRFMNAASGGVEHEYTRATEAIEQARQLRFDALAEYGAQPDTLSAEGFYQQQALADLAREGHPIRPPEQQTGSKRVFNGFAVFSKFFVGVISGVSINLLFNPESRLYLTVIALTAGIMFSVLLLWLVDELAYRAKMAVSTPGMGRPAAYIGGILAVSVLYLGVEGYLNWDGILRVTQQIAANAAQQGQLTDLSTTTDTNAVPQHWSLLAFTMSLVAMAVGAALLQGRERARTVLE